MKIYIPILLMVLLAVACGGKKTTHPPNDADITGNGDSDFIAVDAEEMKEAEADADIVTGDETQDILSDETADAVNDTDETPDTELPDESADELLPDDDEDTWTPDDDGDIFVVPDEINDGVVPDETADTWVSDESVDETPDADTVQPPLKGNNGLIFVSGAAAAEGSATKAMISLGGAAPLGTAKGANYSLKLGY